MLNPKKMIAGVKTAPEYVQTSLLTIVQREGEDACVTGMTRSLTRRLLALNVPGSLRIAAKPATSIPPTAMLRRIA